MIQTYQMKLKLKRNTHQQSQMKALKRRESKRHMVLNKVLYEHSRKWVTAHMETTGIIHIRAVLKGHDQWSACKQVSVWSGSGWASDESEKYERCSQNQVSRCHTHSGNGNWHNVR